MYHKRDDNNTPIKDLFDTIWKETHTHATAPTATHAAESGKIHYITDVNVSSDKAGSILLIKDGTTTIWQIQVGAAYFTHRFKTPLAGTSGAAVSVTIDSTTAGKANLAGFTI